MEESRPRPSALQFEGTTEMWVSMTKMIMCGFTICKPLSQKSSVHNGTSRTNIMTFVPGSHIKKPTQKRHIDELYVTGQ